MAKSSVVGALRVTLGLDTAQFETGMKSAQNGLARFASVAKQGALAIGTAMVAAGGALAIAMKGVVDEADRMSKLSQSLGIPIDQLSKLKYAASLADVDLDALEKSVRRLSASMMEAGQSATGAAAKAFQMLGVSVKDVEGKMRPATEVIEDISARFARMPNGVEKTALAMKLFGKAGADMIPLLNEGKDGLAEMYREAEELGIVLDTQTGKAAEDFNDNLTRLGVVKDGIVTKITTGMLPALAGLTGSLVEVAKNSDMLRRVGAALGGVLQFLATAAVTTGGFFAVLASDIATAAMVAGKWATGDFGGAAASLAVGSARHDNMLAGIRSINTAIWSPRQGRSSFAVAAADADDLETAAGGARHGVERLTAAEREAQRAAAEMAREGRQTFEQTRTPLEQYTARVEELGRQLRAAAIDQDTFNRAMKQARDRLDEQDPLVQAYNRMREDAAEQAKEDRADRIRLASEHEDDMRQATFEGISDGLYAAADGNLGQYLVSRLRDALFDGLANTLTDLLRGPKGGNGGAVGWLKTAGSMISNVMGSMKTPGFATGGSFKVGGAGGIDSQLMQFRATPGEMVDIRKPGQDRSGAMTLTVEASPWFDVRAGKAAEPVAARAGVQAFGAARQQVPADQARRRRFNLTGG
ncbi:MAG: hypothetical protein EON90_02055 [Brevundimonas sp.]|nr:MAG: hypothetical protein EON90_02055 [Brevundimonas sp.]